MYVYLFAMFFIYLGSSLFCLSLILDSAHVKLASILVQLVVYNRQVLHYFLYSLSLDSPQMQTMYVWYSPVFSTARSIITDKFFIA